jgi:hypothetical protein
LKSSRAKVATVGDFRPRSYADSVGREVPARRASSSWVSPELVRTCSSRSAASITPTVYPIGYVSDRIPEHQLAPIEGALGYGHPTLELILVSCDVGLPILLTLTLEIWELRKRPANRPPRLATAKGGQLRGGRGRTRRRQPCRPRPEQD